ncbi:Alpha-(1,3)-fucosyltransferase C, partial [Habropoda laboriosa]
IEIASKKKAIVSYPQDCEAKNGRAEYAAELSKHIDVDVYGECGNYNCSYGGDCFSKVFERDYYFYLSFESALCEDFVTEHLYNPLRYDIVPIVYGAANYSLFAPPQSYVNAFDFDTPEDLAKYLQWLIDHPDIYKKYFAWKQYYEIEDGTPRAICSLCKFLHEQREPKVYPILSRWSSVGKCPLQRLLYTHRYLTRHVLNKT